MYAIIKTGGKQLKVEEGQTIYVEKLNANAGDKVTFDQVVFVGGEKTVIGTPVVEGAKVVCEVATSLVKGDKVLVFHKKRRKGYRKLNGHRQQFTELTIKQVIA